MCRGVVGVMAPAGRIGAGLSGSCLCVRFGVRFGWPVDEDEHGGQEEEIAGQGDADDEGGEEAHVDACGEEGEGETEESRD